MECCRSVVWTLIALSLGVVEPARAQGPIDRQLAKSYFAEAKALSDEDGGKLWGRALYGPMLFVDRVSQAVVANEPAEGTGLAARDGVYAGTLPPEVTVANTATDWAGKRWTMLLWPLPVDRLARRQLLAHESWHRIQDDLGFPMVSPRNAHLDSLDGRAWSRLEWRSLVAALSAQSDARRQAVEDALIFRAYRRSLISTAAEDERALENHEGLAEFTGVLLAGGSERDRNRRLAAKLKELEASESFSRSFAYLSGPLYGLLLTGASPDWQHNFTSTDDLGSKLQVALKIELPDDLESAARERMGTYDGERVLRVEERRDSKRQAQLAADRETYLTGPTLRLPLRQAKTEFDPRNVRTLEDAGTIYPTLKLMDDWGTLETSEGALVGADWTWASVPVPADWSGGLQAKDLPWTLLLAPNWTIAPAEGNHGWHLQKQ